MDTTVTTLPKTPGELVKAVFSFIGKSILILFGIIMIVSVIVDIFEQSMSFLEISTLEMFFFVVLFFLVKNYIRTASEYGLTWRRTVYLPLRNLGWLGILSMLFIFILISQDSHIFIFKYENLLQLINYIGVAICFYLATPSDDKHKESNTDVEAPVEENT
jgi:hypothetical protein